MTRKSSKANKEKRAKEKEPDVERFRPLEELNQEFSQRKNGGFRSLTELTKDFQEQGHPAREARKTPQSLPKEVDQTPITHGTGILKKIFEGRGFGFITPDQDHGAGDVFLHFSDISGGGARSLGIGTWVRYDIELDTQSGRLRAKNVTVLPTTPSTSASESSNPSPEMRQATASPSTTACAYNRDIMLGILKALVASSRLDKSSVLKLSTVPMPPCRDEDEEDPHLDDERLIARLEARLDKETGADALNMQTFGACSGWTFEEAVAANEKLRIVTESEDAMTGAGSSGSSSEPRRASSSFSEPTDEAADVEVSEREDESDTSEGRRREARQEVPPRDEAPGKDRTWSWAAASQQAKLLENHRQSWEVEQKQLLLGAAPLQVFQ